MFGGADDLVQQLLAFEEDDPAADGRDVAWDAARAVAVTAQEAWHRALCTSQHV